MTIHFSNPQPKVWVFALLSFLSLPSLFSQNAELGVVFGGTGYRGDIEVRPNVTLQQMRPMAGLFYRYHTSKRWAFRGQLAFAQFRADEKYSLADWRQMRGISFTTSMVELSVLPELRLFQIGNIDFYAFTGVSGFYFKHTTDYNEPNSIIGDKNLDKNADYSKLSWGIPIGGGLQWFINERTALGVELSGRKSFTDYLDGLSLAGNSKAKDYYYFANLTLSTFFGQKQRGGAGRGNRNVGCPTFD